MTMFTLIMGIALVLAIVGDALVVVVGLALLWTARRVGDGVLAKGEIASVRAEVGTVSSGLRDLAESFDSYRKRDAGRTSADNKRARRANGEAPPEGESPAPITREDLLDMVHQ